MNRKSQIINILLNSKEPVTADYIAEEIGVSNKTIRNDLKEIDEQIKDMDISIIRKPGIGISLVGSESVKIQLLNQLDGETYVIEPYSPEDRVNYILKRLFMSNTSTTIKELADELYVSRVTVHKDLEEVEDWLGQYNLKLIKKTNYGIEVYGKEDDQRSAVASLIVVDRESDELKEMLYNDCCASCGRIDYKTEAKLKELINIDYKQLQRIVTKAESKLKFRFSDEAYISLVIHIAISIKRLKSKKNICLSKEVLKSLKEKDEYKIAEEMASDIEEAFKVKLPESEIGYILLHIIGAKMQQNITDGTSLNLAYEDYEKDDELSVTMSKEIISIAQRALGMNLSNDTSLLNGLILHLRPTINRLKYGLSLRNPILDQIKENYPEIYGVAWMTSIVFEKYIGVKITDEEIGYIALHLGAAVERYQKPFKAIVVCTSGIGTSQLLAAKLDKYFRQIEIKGVVSVTSLKEIETSDIDIIISTIPIESDNKPVVNISPLLNQNDIKKLDSFLNDFKKQEENKKNSKYNIEILYIKLNKAFANKNDVIGYICGELVNKDCVTTEYLESAINREDIGTTSIGNGIAIPHGMPQYVKRTAIGFTKLKKTIDWNGDKVDMVFMLCISMKDIKNANIIMKNIFDKINSCEFIDELRNATDDKTINNVLGGIFNDY
jgi:transcriptional antiterminator